MCTYANAQWGTCIAFRCISQKHDMIYDIIYSHPLQYAHVCNISLYFWTHNSWKDCCVMPYDCMILWEQQAMQWHRGISSDSSPRWTRKKPAKPKRNKAAKQRPILTEFLSDQVKTCCSKNGWCNAMYCLSLKVVIFCEYVLLQNCKPTPAKHRNTIHSACKVARIRRQTHAQGQSACYASPAFRQQNPKSVDPSCYGQRVVTISGPSPSDPNLKIASCCWRTRYQVLQSVFLDLSCTPTKNTFQAIAISLAYPGWSWLMVVDPNQWAEQQKHMPHFSQTLAMRLSPCLTSVAHESIISMLDFATSTAFVYIYIILFAMAKIHQLSWTSWSTLINSIIFFNSIACQKYPSLSLVQHTEDVSLWAKFNLATFEIS